MNSVLLQTQVNVQEQSSKTFWAERTPGTCRATRRAKVTLRRKPAYATPYEYLGPDDFVTLRCLVHQVNHLDIVIVMPLLQRDTWALRSQEERAQAVSSKANSQASFTCS